MSLVEDYENSDIRIRVTLMNGIILMVVTMTRPDLTRRVEKWIQYTKDLEESQEKRGVE